MQKTILLPEAAPRPRRARPAADRQPGRHAYRVLESHASGTWPVGFSVFCDPCD